MQNIMIFFVSFENLKRYLFLVQWCYFIVLMSTPLLENGRAFWKHPSLLCGRKKNVTNEDESEGVASTRY